MKFFTWLIPKPEFVIKYRMIENKEENKKTKNENLTFTIFIYSCCGKK